MNLDIAKIARMNYFNLELKSLGKVICTSFTAGYFSEIETKITKPNIRSIDVLRFLFGEIARKSRDDISDAHDPSNDPRFTALELIPVTDSEIEDFAEGLAKKNLFIFNIEKGKYLEKAVSEAYSEYFIRGIRHHLTEQRAKLKKQLAPYSAIQDMALSKSRVEALSVASRYLLNTSATDAISQQFEHDKDALRLATSQADVAREYIEQQSSSLAMAKSYISNDLTAIETANKLVLNQTLSASAISLLDIQQDALALQKIQSSIYALPNMSLMTSIFASYQLGKVAEFTAIESLNQKRFIQSITSPWINTVDAARSVSGVLELQGIGDALRSTSGFNMGLTDALRFDLGDWRDKIDFTKFELLNPVIRTDFYLGRGFNSALTDLPEQAFEQSLELAGLNSDVFNFESNEDTPQLDGNISEELGLQRTNKCHDILQRFERKLRQVIDYLMTKQYGSDWPKKKLQPIIYDKWEEKRKKAETYGDNIPVIELLDFTEYAIIICQKDLWNEIFKNIFRRPESVRESFQRLYPIRLNTMHSRIVTAEDKLYLEVEVRRILRAIQKVSIQ